MPNFWFLPSSF